MSRAELILPELTPSEIRGIRRVAHAAGSRVRLTQSSAVDEPTDPAKRAESQDLVARLSVYTMTSTIMFVCVPLGAALFFFNILGGENFRTTAHAMALTGLGLALDMTEFGSAVFATL